MKILFQVAPVIFVALYTLLFFPKALGIDKTCKPCQCCVNGSCLLYENGLVNKCNNGCIDGYFGGRCWNRCPANCTVCKGKRICTVCEDGYFINAYKVVEDGKTWSYKRCSLLCRNTCKSCLTYDNCTECTPGFYGLNCSNTCLDRCFNNNCNKSNGTCDACKYGFTGYQCDACVDGLYGENCTRECPVGCLADKCDKSNGTCDACKYGFTGDQCDACVDGLFGENCTRACPVGCLADKCDKSNGTCDACKYGFTGDQCDACVDGLFGENCIRACPVGCLADKCDKSNGTCDACKYGFSGDQCDACVDGLFGENCTRACPVGCLADKCDKSNGTCEACKYGFTGEQCDACVDGLFCENCTRECPVGCLVDKCDKSNGTCEACKYGFTGEQCDACVDGLFGGNCTRECPVGCLADKCDKTNGTCDTCKSQFKGQSCDSCNDGLFGEDCSDVCPVRCNTSKCHRANGTCNQCKYGFRGQSCNACIEGLFGINCSNTCPFGCKTCDKSNGTCLGECKTGMGYGIYCNESCNSNCKNDKCDWITGRCIEGCKPNMYGITCLDICSDKCHSENTISSSCHVSNGTCKFGCVTGYYGEKCERNCSVNCLNQTCEQTTAICQHGCTGDFKDQTCEQELNGRNREAGNSTVIEGVVVVVALITVLVATLILLWRRRKKKHVPGNLYEHSVFYNNITTDDNACAIISTPGNEEGNHPDLKTDDSRIYENTRLSICESNNAIMATEIHDTRDIATDVLDTRGIATDVLDTRDIIATEENASPNGVYRNVKRRIEVDKLQEYVADKQKVDFENEFLNFPNGLLDDKSYAESQKPGNKTRNRFRYVYPYDDHRVTLTGPGSDYINASYIDGFDQPNAYIACLGPTEKTTEYFVTFWRMVWQQKVEKIVMLTNLYENGGNKCDKYWPDTNVNGTYGAITVTCLSEDVFSEYTVRCFTVSQKSENRSLHHIHFTSWPDKRVPDDVASLIEFRQKVNSIQTTLKGPMIVHCSAGIGRTGTYLALDILTNEGEAQNSVDIFGCVLHMREHRLNMVQTAGQYEYLHYALVYSLTFDCQAIHADTFQQYVDELNDTNIGEMFKLLNVTTERDSETEVAARARNGSVIAANRPGADVPGDRHLRKLYVQTKLLATGYINAVYVDSFKRKNRYIVTQTPLPETVVDFLHLVWQTKCCYIVSMEPQGVFKSKTVASYFWTDNQVLKLGTFRITCVEEGSTPYCVIHRLTIEYDEQGAMSEERTVYHFQYTQWDGNQVVPQTPESLLGMIVDVENRSNNIANDGPIIVHCLTAGQRSGLFCAVSILIQKLEIDYEASVVNTVRKIRSRRKNAIPDKEQYWFCFRCISAFMTSFNTYSNISMTS